MPKPADKANSNSRFVKVPRETWQLVLTLLEEQGHAAFAAVAHAQARECPECDSDDPGDGPPPPPGG